MANKLYDETSIQAIAGAIREKNGSLNTYKVREMAEAIENIPSVPPEQSVFFYDYDGTLITSYTKEAFLALSNLPSNPTHENLVAQGWNWSLSDAKEYITNHDYLVIGQMYTTIDNKTKIFIQTGGALNLSLKMSRQTSETTTVIIDWGDSTIETKEITASTIKHEYVPGQYTIIIEVVTGTISLGLNSDEIYLCEKVFFGTGITQLVDNCFNGFSTLKFVTLSDSFQELGVSIFQSCYSLSAVIIPSSVRIIGARIVGSCYTLKAISFPNNAIITSVNTFNSCFNLSQENLFIPDENYIAEGLFVGCHQLKTINISDSITEIKARAFSYCDCLSSITISNNITVIGNEAFRDSGLIEIELPDSISQIGTSILRSCSFLKYAKLPKNITTIPTSSFQDCTVLTTVEMPTHLVAIDSRAFSSCTCLSSIEIPSSVTSIGAEAFSGCSSLASINIPEGIETIATRCFQTCYSLTSVTIPSSVTAINEGAFQYCSKCARFYIKATTPPTLENVNAFYGSNIIYVPRDAVSAYKSASVWKDIKSRIFADPST